MGAQLGRIQLRDDLALLDEIAFLHPDLGNPAGKLGGDIDALWRRLNKTELQITEWRGTSASVFAPTGPAAADYVQIALGRESEWQAGPARAHAIEQYYWAATREFRTKIQPMLGAPFDQRAHSKLE